MFFISIFYFLFTLANVVTDNRIDDVLRDSDGAAARVIQSPPLAGDAAHDRIKNAATMIVENALDESADPVSEPVGSPLEKLQVEVQGLIIDYPVFFATVLPGEILNIQVIGRPDDADITFDTDLADGMLVDRMKLSWKAPDETELYTIKISDDDSGELITINIFVLEPATNIVDGKLNGYRIGQYPTKPLRNNRIYAAPLGFIEVTPELADTRISPNFTVGQFLCKQATRAKAKYVVLRPALILKLERLVALLNARGIETDSLFIMSGYRTPFYNKSIGNVQYSRHVYGDAADIYVDYQPRDGEMDDINGDGVVNRRDAAFLFDLVDEFERDDVNLAIRGGLGEYDRNAVRGPFVHVDVRGVPARWGR
ncbi:MAG: hypothetical protein HKN14_06035 [Marinicaulis sp.]|nr:hypothetical protein [Marinicaulis sp.]